MPERPPVVVNWALSETPVSTKEFSAVKAACARSTYCVKNHCSPTRLPIQGDAAGPLACTVMSENKQS